MARHFRTGIDAMVREVELEELEKKWAAQNKRIMEEHPPETAAAESVGEAVALPAPAAGSAAGEAPFRAEPEPAGAAQIGRASRREGEGQYVKISVGAVT